MKATIPHELVHLVPLAVMTVLENISDITHAAFNCADAKESRFALIAVGIDLRGSDWDSFMALRRAGANPSWNTQLHGGGWSVTFQPTIDPASTGFTAAI